MRRGVALGALVAVALAATAGAEEATTYRKHIKPLFDAMCAKCHGADAAPELAAFKEDKEKWMEDGKGMRLDTYSHLVFYTAWQDAGSLMRRLDDGKNTKDGKPGNMNKYLGKTDAEIAKNLAVFKAWVGNWTLKRWKEITKEELDGIKVPY